MTFKENWPLKFIRFFLCTYLISIISLKFHTNSPVTFFAAPSNAFLIIAISLIFIIYLYNIEQGVNYIASLPKIILATYFLFALIFLIKTLLSIEVSSLIVTGFLPTLIFYLLLPAFEDKVIDLSLIFVKATIISGLLITVAELYLFYEFRDFYSANFYNRNNHYAHNMIENSIFVIRPYGLTGSFTINSVIFILCAQYILYIDALISKGKEAISGKLLYVMMSFLGVMLTQSGTGYFLLVILIYANFFRIGRLWELLYTVPLAIILLVSLGDFFGIHKISSEYFFHNFEIMRKFFDSINEFGNIIFGPVGINYIDTLLPFLVNQVGLLGLIFFLLTFCSIYNKSKYQGRAFVLLLFFGSFRYPSLANQVVQILIAFYFYTLYFYNTSSQRSCR